MKIKAMTNREWVKNHFPRDLSKTDLGGVIGCPSDYGLKERICTDVEIAVEKGSEPKCTYCWNLPAKYKRNGKYIMQRVK